MSSLELPNCAFCDHQSIEDRVIRIVNTCLSLASSPWYRPDHALVIPKRHIEHVFELSDKERDEYYQEIGRLARRMADPNYPNSVGYQIMVKNQPDQPENGIKMNHLHTHVFPRQLDDELIAGPRSFADMYPPSLQDIAFTQYRLGASENVTPLQRGSTP